MYTPLSNQRIQPAPQFSAPQNPLLALGFLLVPLPRPRFKDVMQSTCSSSPLWLVFLPCIVDSFCWRDEWTYTTPSCVHNSLMFSVQIYILAIQTARRGWHGKTLSFEFIFPAQSFYLNKKNAILREFIVSDSNQKALLYIHALLIAKVEASQSLNQLSWSLTAIHIYTDASWIWEDRPLHFRDEGACPLTFTWWVWVGWCVSCGYPQPPPPFWRISLVRTLSPLPLSMRPSIPLALSHLQKATSWRQSCAHPSDAAAATLLSLQVSTIYADAWHPFSPFTVPCVRLRICVWILVESSMHRHLHLRVEFFIENWYLLTHFLIQTYDAGTRDRTSNISSQVSDFSNSFSQSIEEI